MSPSPAGIRAGAAYIELYVNNDRLLSGDTMPMSAPVWASGPASAVVTPAGGC